jgi:hypothetical protein
MIVGGPRVTEPSSLRWNRHGYDLVLRNCEACDAGTFTELIDAFELAASKNATLIVDLRLWTANAARLRWSQESCRRLLRWAITRGPTYKRAIPAAEAVWVSLFGRPIPGWAIWNSREERNEFDQEAWNVWYNSLPH